MTGGQGVQKSWRCDHRPVRRNWSLHNEHFGAESVHPHRQVTDLMAPALAPDRCQGGWIWEKDARLGETLVTRQAFRKDSPPKSGSRQRQREQV